MQKSVFPKFVDKLTAFTRTLKIGPGFDPSTDIGPMIGGSYRARVDKQVKDAELPFEDERFSYVALTRTAVEGRRPSRVLAQPGVNKVEITAKLCSPEGLAVARVPRRTKADYANARRWRWGDAVIGQR